MGQEDTRRARHRQQISVGSLDVVLQHIIGSTIGIVIINERDGITGIAGTDQGFGSIAGQILPRRTTIIKGVIHHIFEGEVEGRARLTRVVDPGLYRRKTVPALTNGIRRVGTLIVDLRVLGSISFHHIITEAGITDLILQIVEIDFYVLLCRTVCMVEVTIAVEVSTGIISARNLSFYRRRRVRISLIGFTDL